MINNFELFKKNKILKNDNYIKKNIKNYVRYFRKNIKIFFKLKKNTIEISGSGGDKKKTFNISSFIFIIIFLININVFKQGSVSYTSNTGSVDFLHNVLKYYSFKTKKIIKRIYNKIKFITLKANILYNKNFFPKNFYYYRKSINNYSIFNYSLPFTNPFNLKKSYCCISNNKFKNEIIKNLIKIYKKFILICSYDGMDEVSLFNYVKVYKFSKNKIFTYILKSENLFLKGYFKNIISNKVEDSVKKFYKFLLYKNNSVINIVILSCSIIIRFLSFTKNYNNTIFYLKKKLKEGFFLNRFINLKKKLKCLLKK